MYGWRRPKTVGRGEVRTAGGETQRGGRRIQARGGLTTVRRGGGRIIGRLNRVGRGGTRMTQG